MGINSVVPKFLFCSEMHGYEYNHGYMSHVTGMHDSLN